MEAPRHYSVCTHALGDLVPPVGASPLGTFNLPFLAGRAKQKSDTQDCSEIPRHTSFPDIPISLQGMRSSQQMRPGQQVLQCSATDKSEGSNQTPRTKFARVRFSDVIDPAPPS